jgi:outer membrane receptor protein involved in Fe transport
VKISTIINIIFVTTFIISAPLFADEADVVEELPEIVITATGTDKTEYEVPYMVDVVDNEEFATERMARTVPDALRETPGVLMQKSGYGQASPFLRGFTGFRTLFLVDGIRFNNSTYRSGPNQYLATVDPYSLSRLEVIMGPGSVLYGSDAVGGTINMISLSRPPDGPEGLYPNLLYRYATAEDSSTYRAQLGGVSGKLGLYVGMTFRNFGDYRAGPEIGVYDKTGYDEASADFKVQYLISPDLEITLAYQRFFQNDVWRTHTTIYSESWEDTTVGDEKMRVLDQERNLVYIQLKSYDLGHLADEAVFSLSSHFQEEVQNRTKADDTKDSQGTDVNTIGVFVNLRKNLSGNANIVYGAEYYRDDVESFKEKYDTDGSLTSVAIQGPVGDDAVYETYGLYAQGDIWVGERLEVLIGGRYSYIATEIDKVEDPDTGLKMSVDDDWEALVGNARAVYYLNSQKTVNFYTGVGQAFRAPNLSDLTRMDAAHESNEVEVPSPKLDPEKYIMYEAGFKTMTDRFTGQIGYYYTDIEDMIVRTPTGDTIDGNIVVTKKNTGDGFIEGAETSMSAALTDNLTFFGSYAWVYGRVETYPEANAKKQSDYKDRLMPDTGLVGLRFHSNSEKYWAEVSGVFTEKADRLSSRDQRDTQRIPPGGTPAYQVYGIRAGAKLKNGVNLSAAIENITDEDYRTHGSGQNEPGTNLIVGIQFKP